MLTMLTMVVMAGSPLIVCTDQEPGPEIVA